MTLDDLKKLIEARRAEYAAKVDEFFASKNDVACDAFLERGIALEDLVRDIEQAEEKEAGK